MNNFDLGSMLARFTNNRIFVNRPMSVNPQVQQATESFAQNIQPNTASTLSYETANLQMNTLKSMDRAVYVKEVMKLPKNLNELIFILQKGINQVQFNSMYARQIAAQRNTISQTQAQILAQLQGLTTQNEVQALIQSQVSTQFQAMIKNLPLSSSGMINLSQIAEMIQINGKEALAKLIVGIAQASKQGINDVSQLKDIAKLINASVATAAKNDPAQTMKLLMLFYLPWLPLEEGVGFDLEIESNEEKEESDSILTITITTVNYGIVVATLVLETSNSVHADIECSKDFPKEELQQRINNDEKHYSMESIVSFNEKEVKLSEEKKAKAQINMSQTTEINPFMLLMAHTIIRHVIEIDNNKSIGITSHVD